MKNPSALLILAAVTVAVSQFSCAKSQKKAALTQADPVIAMSKSLAVPAPDRSYSARDASGIRVSGSNYSLLMTSIVDPVAKGLKVAA